MLNKKVQVWLSIFSLLVFVYQFAFAQTLTREEKRKQEHEELQKRFKWWPTDAQPGPVRDPERGGYWWWPTQPGEIRPWGNRGYVYVYKIIFDYMEEELPPPKPQELRPSLLIKKIIKNVKIYFDYDKANLRDDAIKILKSAVETLKRNPEASILVTGNCDRRGSEAYNEKLGRRRGEAVKKFMLDNGIAEERIKIISRGKLDAVAPITDLVGMQKDRNAQFMIAEVEEVMLPYPGEPEVPEAKEIEEGKFLIEEEKEIESEVKVSTKEYVIQKGDSLWKIAQKELGSGHRWKYLYELNKDKIRDPNKLKPGLKIIIPIE
jgi:outer membrane protein OmpA-like peptidoglycan-associated protein